MDRKRWEKMCRECEGARKICSSEKKIVAKQDKIGRRKTKQKRY